MFQNIICCYLSESLRFKKFVHHSNDGCTFGIRYSVKDLINFIWMLDRDGDGMRAFESINTKYTLKSQVN